MSEPAGLLIEAQISENRLASFFGRSVAYGKGRALVGHVLCRWADSCDRPGSDYPHEGVLVVDHDKESNTLFLAWILNELTTDAMDAMWPVLETLAREMEPPAVGSGTVSSIYGAECYETVRIENRTLIHGPEENVAEEELTRLWGRALAFWGIGADGTEAASAEVAEQPSFFICDALRAEWPNYVKWSDEERRAQLAAATEANPLRLVDRVYYWDGQVVERYTIPPLGCNTLAEASGRVWEEREIPFLGADPMTFRAAAGFYADKNYVWQQRLAPDSPPAFTNESGSLPNPEAIWENVPVEGAVGADFTYFGDRFTLFWTDKRRIYARREGVEGELIALPDVNASEFRTHGRFFGTDGTSVFYCAVRLPLRADHLETEGSFIWDDEKVFFDDFEVPLSGATFRILGQEGNEFRIADANRALILGPGNTLTLDDAES